MTATNSKLIWSLYIHQSSCPSARLTTLCYWGLLYLLWGINTAIYQCCVCDWWSLIASFSWVALASSEAWKSQKKKVKWVFFPCTFIHYVRIKLKGFFKLTLNYKRLTSPQGRWIYGDVLSENKLLRGELSCFIKRGPVAGDDLSGGQWTQCLIFSSCLYGFSKTGIRFLNQIESFFKLSANHLILTSPQDKWPAWCKQILSLWI